MTMHSFGINVNKCRVGNKGELPLSVYKLFKLEMLIFFFRNGLDREV